MLTSMQGMLVTHGCKGPNMQAVVLECLLTRVAGRAENSPTGSRLGSRSQDFSSIEVDCTYQDFTYKSIYSSSMYMDGE